MKRISFILAILFVGTLQLLAQARLTVNKESVDFGQIEWNKPVIVDYTITNSGEIPLIIANVTTSCACSVASWPSSPIEPGEKGVIRVDFDAKALGQFYKEIAIYSNSTPNIVYLNFTGEVVREITDFSKSHPVKIGGIRLSKASFDFGDILVGEKPSVKIGVVNETDAPYAPILMHTPPYFLVKSTDLYLQKGEKGEFEISLDTDMLVNYGRFDSEIYLSRFVGDKVGLDNRIPFSYTLLPDLEYMKDNLSVKIPDMILSQKEYDLSALLLGKKKGSEQISIENKGKGELKILKIQTFSPAIQLKLNKASLKSGEIAKLKIIIDTKKQLSKEDDLSFIIITNDPYHTKTVVNIK